MRINLLGVPLYAGGGALGYDRHIAAGRKDDCEQIEAVSITQYVGMLGHKS